MIPDPNSTTPIPNLRTINLIKHLLPYEPRGERPKDLWGQMHVAAPGGLVRAIATEISCQKASDGRKMAFEMLTLPKTKRFRHGRPDRGRAACPALFCVRRD